MENTISRYHMKCRLCLIIVLLLILNALAETQENYRVLPWKLNAAFSSYLLQTVHQQYSERQENVKQALSSEQALISYREECKKRYLGILGDLPQKTDLRARNTGTTQLEGFRVEKIIYESVPNRHVTCNLYIPDGEGPFPAALFLCGHSADGKISHQKLPILFALNGIATMVVDPISQGERFQLTDSAGKSLVHRATTEHTILNAGSALVGTSIAAYMYWDNLRALDYLETRSDIDRNRIGCLGSSGGGTQTTYLIALDERIKVAAISSFITQRDRQLEVFGPDDGCQYIPNEGREHLELSDFLIMFAPRPLLILASKFDFVDYWGTTNVFGELKNVYGALNEVDKIEMFPLEGGHGMPVPEREAAATWFRKWLCNDGTPIRESDDIAVAESALLCTQSGQVTTAFPDEITIQQNNYQISRRYASRRSEFMKSDTMIIATTILEMLGNPDFKERIIVESTGSSSLKNYRLGKYQVLRKGEMPVPCLVIYPGNIIPASEIVICLNDRGKEEFIRNTDTIDVYLNRGDILVLADLRGIGETFDTLDSKETKFWFREYGKAMIGLHAGRPVIGQRVVDIISVVDFISSDSLMKNHSIKVMANGDCGPAAIHAAFLDRRIARTEISRSIKSFEQLILNPIQNYSYTNVLYGVLRNYDLEDLVSRIGGERISFIE